MLYLEQEKADSKVMPTAAFMGLAHGLSFSMWVMC